MTLVLCPHQLFQNEPIELVKREKLQEVMIWEDPVFFGDRKGSPHGSRRLRLNKMRIIYMRVATKWYVEYLREHLPGNVQILHVGVHELWNIPISTRYDLWKGKHIWMFDPMDHLFLKRAGAFLTSMVDTPQFLLSKRDVQEYAKQSQGKRLQHSQFFAFVKAKMGLLMDTPSMDTMNRQSFPRTATLPPSPFLDLVASKDDRREMWAEQTQWLEKGGIFNNNPGSTQDIGYAVTFKDVNAWFRKFLKERFSLFGKYEDAAVAESHWMYHSGIAIYLNMGLITPKQVIDILHEPQYRHLTKQLNNYEGFLRQLMGWREYTRYYYEMVPPSIYLKNVFGMKKGRLPSSWYMKGVKDTDTKQSKIENKFIRDTIQDAWNTGYLHHIRRLMVISNYMTLSGIHPDRVFDWMYEFSMDSWDWVMVFNVYSMGTWSDGGHAMRKPYISGSSYLRRMANLKDPDDSYNWDEKFKNFLKHHKDILKHTQLAKLLQNL